MWEATCIVILLVVLLLYKGTRKPKRFPPGPPRLPIVGSLPYMAVRSKPSEPKSLLTGVRKAVAQYGKTVGFYIANEPAVVVADYDAIKRLLKRDEVSARPSLRPFTDFRPGSWVLDKENEGRVPGVLFIHGKYWSEQRRFSLRVLRDFGFGKTSMENTLCDEVEKLCTEFTKVEGTPFNMQRRINISIVNALWAILVGEKLALNDPKLTKIVTLLDRAVRGQQPSAALASMFPIPEMIRWPIISHLMLRMDDLKQALKDIELFAKPYIAEHKSSLDEDSGPRDFVDAYLLEIAKHDGDNTSSFHKECGHYMLLNLIIEYFAVGTETTSSAIVWTFLLLLHHPKIKRKVHKEIDEVIGQNRDPQLSDRDEMPYTNAVLDESLRIVSFVFLSAPHFATTDVEIGEYVIPKGATVLPSLMHVMLDPDHFPNPHKFNPDRFIDEQGRFKHHERVIPFGIGKRYCLGQTLAEKEFFLFFTGILQKFDINPAPMKKLPSYDISEHTPVETAFLRSCPNYELILTGRK